MRQLAHFHRVYSHAASVMPLACAGHARSAAEEVKRHLDEGESSGVNNPHPPCNPGACIVTNLDPNEIDPVRALVQRRRYQPLHHTVHATGRLCAFAAFA
eukprot:SAG11_NODE_557_length_8549_cov_5.574675_6_plen_100_part_00